MHTGSEDEPAAESTPTRSLCEPYRELIATKLDQGLSATRIHQDLVSEHDFCGSYYTVMRYVRRQQAVTGLPFRRIETAPGEEAQVDFGTGARVLSADGRRRKTHLFRIVLSYSRKAYSEAVFRQTTENFIRALKTRFGTLGVFPVLS